MMSGSTLKAHTQCSLRYMGRRQLQSLAKKYNIKANISSEDIIRQVMVAQWQTGDSESTVPDSRKRKLGDVGEKRPMKRSRRSQTEPGRRSSSKSSLFSVQSSLDEKPPHHKVMAGIKGKGCAMVEFAKRAIAMRRSLRENRMILMTMSGRIKSARQISDSYREGIRAEMGRLERIKLLLQSYDPVRGSDSESELEYGSDSDSEDE